MNNSILKVHCSGNASFGTGFIVKTDSFGSYLITCGHVVKKLEGQILVDDKFGELYVNKYDEGIDLAVVYVKGLIADEFSFIEPCEHSSYQVIGFTSFSNKIKKEPIGNIKIKEGLEIENENGIKTNILKIYTTEDISSGYSGSPIICNRTGSVVGVTYLQESKTTNYGILNKHISELIDVNISKNTHTPQKKLKTDINEQHVFYISKTLTNYFEKSLSCFSTQNCTWLEPKLFSKPESNRERERSEYITIKDIIDNPRSIKINAYQQYGLTSLAKYFVKEAWNKEEKSFWLYLDVSNLKANKKSIERYIENQISEFTLNFDDVECVVVDEVSTSIDNISKILSFINEIFIDIPIIVMCSVSSGVNITEDAILIERYLENKYLWSLTRNEIRNIVCAYNSKNKYIENDNIVINRLASDLEVLNVPRTPLNCLTFLKIYENDFDESPVNRTAMISKVLHLLFNVDEIPKYKTRPDLKDSEYVLGYFCEKIIREHRFYFTREEFLSEVKDFCLESEIDLEIEVIFDVLAANNIIVQRLNKFCFKFSYWVFYFAAHRMHQDIDFCDFIFNDMNYVSYPEIIEYFTGIDRRSNYALKKLCQDIKDVRVLVESKCRFPDGFDIYSAMRWKPSEQSLDEVKDMITAGAMGSCLPDEIKDSYADKQYDNSRPLRQDVNKIIEEYSLLKLLKTIQSASKALRNSDYAQPKLKHELLNEILYCWELVTKFLVLISPALAKSKTVTVSGASFVLDSSIDGTFEEKMHSLIPVLPSNVVGWYQDDIFTKKMGTFLYNNANTSDSDISRYFLSLLLISKRPEGWADNIKQYITGLHKNSFYLSGLFHELRSVYQYGFVSRKELEDIGLMIKATLAKHNGAKSIGDKAINNIPDKFLPDRIETEVF
ncbi:S1 family peptidase [Photobacterium phosphoreum]|uniref:S1 family peptidase n=1 Tax=Photobacterium phosphoreum TaxID=659 RepID=UPI0015E67849|nr:serine protease [Photobacterium phosphoreum]